MNRTKLFAAAAAIGGTAAAIGLGAPAAAAPAFVARQVGAALDNPWAMVFLPDGRALITEKPGRVRILSLAGTIGAPLAGLPTVSTANGQGGLLDIAISPFFKKDRFVYISFSEPGTGSNAALAVARAKFTNDSFGPWTVLWRNQPTTGGHFGGRIAMTRKYELFVATGDRQQFTPAQTTTGTLGKIVRLTLTGLPKSGNPFAGNPAYRPEIWTLGHRNPYGLAFDPVSGVLWGHEMGPEGGDELNVIVKGRNYGWPNVSNGNNYGGGNIPDHAPGDGFEPPKRFWTPSVSPAGMAFYTGTLFPAWQGHILMGALSGQALLDVSVAGTTAPAEVRHPMGARIREVEVAPDGSVYVLTDGAGARLLRLTPN